MIIYERSDGISAILSIDGEFITVPKEKVFADTGDVLVRDKDIFVKDSKATAERRERLATKKRQLFDR
ncbi:MAG: hypothetical protein IJ251_06270 [Oscillospiraceae bacterium]|nr:hypothetical protein [Oscillospiraceae bacterium]